MKKVLGIMFALLLAASFVRCAVRSSPEQTLEPESAAVKEEPKITVEGVCDQLSDYVSQVYENYEISMNDEKDSVLIYLWQDGLADSLLRASKGIEPYAGKWESNKNTLLDLSVTVQGLFDSAGHPEVSTSVCVRNDLNPDGVMFVAHNGQVILDAVTKK